MAGVPQLGASGGDDAIAKAQLAKVAETPKESTPSIPQMPAVQGTTGAPSAFRR